MSKHLLLLVFALSYGLFRFTTARIKKRQLNKLSQEKGCKPVKNYHAGFLGISRVRTAIAQAKAGTYLEWVLPRYKEKKTWSVPLFGKRVIQTADPENIKAMLATQFDDYSLEYRKKDFVPLLGDGIFNSDGPIWAHSRSMLRPQFSRSQVSDLEALEVHVQRLLKHIPTDGKEIDVQELFQQLTVDAATEFLFGKSTETLLSADGNANMTYGQYSYAKAFSDCQEWGLLRLRLGPFGKVAWLNPSYYACHTALHKIMDDMIASCLTEMKRNSTLASEKAYVPKDGKYIFLHALAHETDDPKFLKDQLLNILLAGRDTTAVLLTWTFFNLSRNPTVYHKLRSEILSYFGTGIDRITFASLKDCIYLRYVLQETLRLFPPVPINSRLATRNTTLPRGGGEDELAPIIIPKGQLIHYCAYALHRREEVFGPDAHDWIPDRWDPDHPSYRKIGGWDYVPFNGGPRICLGQQYALTEAGYVTVRMVQRFAELETHDWEHPTFAASMTMPSARPVKIRFKEGRCES